MMANSFGRPRTATLTRAKAPESKPEPYVSLMTITPAVARDWLAKNVKNRRLRPYVVAKYVSDIRSGNWSLNGDTIKMASNGTIIDGQHRLAAVIDADTPIQAFVASDIDPGAFATIDTGKPRTVIDVLQIEGYPQSTALAAAARLYLIYERSGTFNADTFNVSSSQFRADVGYGTKTAPPSNQEILAVVYKLSEELLVATRATANTRKNLGAGYAPWAVAWMILGDIDRSDRDYFFARATDGQGLVEGDPIYALRRYFLEMRSRAHVNLSQGIIGAIIFKAWNRYRSGTPIKLLSFSRTEDFPRPI